MVAIIIIMKEILRANKLSETPFRKEVLSVFEKYKSAISMAMIENSLNSYNRITLYRTIKVFLEKGIIHEIKISGEVSNYALCSEACTVKGHSHQHIHFKCKKCEMIYCVSIEKFPLISLSNYQIDQLEIQALGTCENCKE